MVRRDFERVLAIRQQLGDRWAEANAQACLAELDLSEGKVDVALHRYGIALSTHIEADNPLGIGTALLGLCGVAIAARQKRIASYLLYAYQTFMRKVAVPVGPSHRELAERLPQVVHPRVFECHQANLMRECEKLRSKIGPQL